jgi:cytochrome c553
MTKRGIAVVVLGWALLVACPASMATGAADVGKLKAAACAACHGFDGNSVGETTPKLAGQMPEYLVKQMRDLQTGRRGNCNGIPRGATQVSESDITDLAAFFTAQPIRPDAVDSARLALGEQIYVKGRKTPHFVPACVGCHGMQGKGKVDWNRIMSAPPAVLASSIGSQHPAYVAGQLRAFRDGRRNNDQAAVMRKLAVNLSDEEIDAVAAYVGAMTR